MERIVFLLSTPEKVSIYVALALSTSAVLFLALYVRHKFARANGALQALTREWTDAEERFFRIAEVAEKQIRKIDRPAPPTTSALRPPPSGLQAAGRLEVDTRSQVAAMGRKGMTAAQIAAASGVSEADVEVLLGMQRIGLGNN